jgi:spore germination cell wall hydrolase CwlJ-like protein
MPPRLLVHYPIFRPRRSCNMVAVNTELRILAVLAALGLAAVAPAAPGSEPPVVQILDTRPATPAPSSAVSFSLPKYKITPLERETVAACLILEAASQGDFGMRGVMAVIRNRARGLPELFAPTVLKQKQFSALNKVTSGRESLRRAIERASRDRMWLTALAIVEDALNDVWYDPTHGATHYTRSVERTHWTRSLAMTAKIGAHSFYR